LIIDLLYKTKMAPNWIKNSSIYYTYKQPSLKNAFE
jgi:hypothetical protein